MEEAEAWLNKGVARAEQAGDTLHLTILRAYLALVKIEQRKIAEARPHVSSALVLGRLLRIPPCTGIALMALAMLRFSQAQASAGRGQKKGGSLSLEETEATREQLKRVVRTLQHILRLTAIESETRTEARLLLAQVTGMLREEGAEELAALALEEATQHDLTWLIARAERVLGATFALQGQQEQAIAHYQRALHLMQTTGMRLDHTHTRKEYEQLLGTMMVAKKTSQEEPPPE